jgi:hypothetical protein
MRALLLLLVAAVGCSKRPPRPTPTLPEPPALQPADNLPRLDMPPTGSWRNQSAVVTLEKSLLKGGLLSIRVSVEASSPDVIVDAGSWRVAAVDSKGNRLKPGPIGHINLAGNVRHGKAAAAVFQFTEPAATAEWVDLSFGPARLRVILSRRAP